jgi:lipoprotein-releasing system ATP-binding protein
MTPQPHVSAVAVEKIYLKGQIRIPVLRGVEMSVQRGEFLTIHGQSGSGKSTLLHLMGLLDSPTVGEVRLCCDSRDGEPADSLRVDNLPAATRDILRNRVFGFIFQFYHLLPELSVLENVLIPLMIRDNAWKYWKRRGEHREQACEIIEKVGLTHRLTHRPSELSGGEMQRAAIARALVSRPEILLADEPTGNLDAQTGQGIMDLLHSLNAEQNLTIVMVTHDESLASQSDRIVRLANGRIEEPLRAVA